MSSAPSTFLDSNVLLAAWRGDVAYSAAAIVLLDDPRREYIASPFLELETIP